MGLFLWSFHILLRQKRAWIAFAQKNGLAFDRRRLFLSAAVSGVMKGVPVTLYSEEQVVNQNGTRRYRTILHIELPPGMKTPGIVASPEAGNFARAQGLKEPYVPEYDFWNKNIVVLSNDAEIMKAYLTEERCRALNPMMSIKTIACILIFDAENTFLRFETPDAFDDENKLDRFVSKAVENAKILSI